MALPAVTEHDVMNFFDGVSAAAEIGIGAQKRVFGVERNGERFALKFVLLPLSLSADAAEQDVTLIRAKRETQIMRDCQSPHIVKLGPIPLEIGTIAAQNVIYFSEELIVGQALNDLLVMNGPLSPEDVIKLGSHITLAITALWQQGKIHRDIKPGNIMRRNSDGSFVLLDAGLAFDVTGDSISAGMMVGTLAYFSPEQFDYSSRRTMDFRSDVFSLGVTLYQMATGAHPFLNPNTSAAQLFNRISSHRPDLPSSINPEIPPALDSVIMRMMGKSPHLRYRRPEHLLAALSQIGVV